MARTPLREWGKTAEDDAARAPSQGNGTERERELHGLAVVSLFLHSAATIQEMMSTLLEHAPGVTRSLLVYPLMLDRKRQLLRASILEGNTDKRLEAAMDAFQEDLTALEFSLVPNPELYRVLEEGEVVIYDDLSILMDKVLPDGQCRDAEQQLGVRCVALVPMVVENEPLGVVLFAFDHRDIDVDTLELMVGHLTLALRDLLVRDEVVRFSDVDPVTWVRNRRYLLQELESEIARAARYGRSLSLIALDIDGFTRFNETYGQSLGDRLLRTVATTLAEAVSPPELVARLKDDDFAVLLPETSRSAAVTAITRLLASLSQVAIFSGEEDEEPITASVAIACFPEDGGTPRALLSRALADLDSAKQDHNAATSDESYEDPPPARAAAQR